MSSLLCRLCLIVGVEYTKKQYTIGGLSPGQCYQLWATAWTDAGEGPRGIFLPVCPDCMCLFIYQYIKDPEPRLFVIDAVLFHLICFFGPV